MTAKFSTEWLMANGFEETGHGSFVRRKKTIRTTQEDIKTVPNRNLTLNRGKDGHLKKIRQSSKTMNRLEAEFFTILSREFTPLSIRAQAVTLRLANGCRYTPDFIVFDELQIIAYEVKGPHTWDDALVKLKVAAANYPRIRFVLCWKQQGDWQRQEVLP